MEAPPAPHFSSFHQPTCEFGQRLAVHVVQGGLAQLLQCSAQAQHAPGAAVPLHQSRHHVGQLQHALQVGQPAGRDGGRGKTHGWEARVDSISEG